jgi:hypothetical protein
VSAPLPSVQERYARWLDAGTRAGFALLVAGFLAYLFGLFEPLVPPQELVSLWQLPLRDYLAATGAPVGWGWLGLLDRSDYFNLAGIALLALVTPVCYAGVIPALLARGERVAALLALVQVLVLLAAASGLLAGGH